MPAPRQGRLPHAPPTVCQPEPAFSLPQKEDLARMYRLFSRIPKGLDPMASLFKTHIEAQGAGGLAAGLESLMGPKGDAGRGSGEGAQGPGTAMGMMRDRVGGGEDPRAARRVASRTRRLLASHRGSHPTQPRDVVWCGKNGRQTPRRCRPGRGGRGDGGGGGEAGTRQGSR